MKITGIPISISPFKEKNAMVNVLTTKGIISFCSYGGLSIKNCNFPSINLFTYSEFTLTDSKKINGLDLKEASLIDSFPKVHNQLNSLASLQFFEEFFKKIIGNEDCSSMFEFLKNILYQLEKGFDALTLILIFIATALKKTGSGLEVNGCVLCGSKKNISSMSFEEGGFLCKNCLDKYNQIMSVEKLKAYRHIFSVGFQGIDQIVINHDISKEMFNELIEFVFNQTGVFLKSSELIKKTL